MIFLFAIWAAVAGTAACEDLFRPAVVEGFFGIVSTHVLAFVPSYSSIGLRARCTKYGLISRREGHGTIDVEGSQTSL